MAMPLAILTGPKPLYLDAASGRLPDLEKQGLTGLHEFLERFPAPGREVLWGCPRGDRARLSELEIRELAGQILDNRAKKERGKR